MKLSAQLKQSVKQSVRALAVAGVASATLIAATVDAKTFRWASQGDVLTMDPHSQNEGLNNTMSDHVYEPLVTRGKTMALEPCLAVSWTQVNPTTMRFKLRDKVTFHKRRVLLRRRCGVLDPARTGKDLRLLGLYAGHQGSEENR